MNTQAMLDKIHAEIDSHNEMLLQGVGDNLYLQGYINGLYRAIELMEEANVKGRG